MTSCSAVQNLLQYEKTLENNVLLELKLSEKILHFICSILYILNSFSLEDVTLI